MVYLAATVPDQSIAHIEAIINNKKGSVSHHGALHSYRYFCTLPHFSVGSVPLAYNINIKI